MFTWNGDVPCGAAKSGGQILGQHIFAGGLAAGQQQVLAAEQGRQCLLPDLTAIIGKAGNGDTGAQGLGQSVGGAVFFHSVQQVGLMPSCRNVSIRSDIQDISLRLALPNRFSALS